MVTEQNAIDVVEERSLPGPAAAIDELRDADDETAANELAIRFADQQAAVPGDRSPLSYLIGLVRRLRGRTPARDLGVHEFRVGWLGFHAPPGGKAQLVLTRTEKGGGGVELKFVGLGFGSGLELKLASERDFGERDSCFTLGSLVRVHLQEFMEASGQPSVQVDVVERIGNYLDSHDRCPLCFTSPEPGPQPRQMEGTWDLSGDQLGLTEKLSYDLTKSSEIEIGLNIPVLSAANLTAGLAVSRSITSSCTATYVLQGGQRFSAYRQLAPGLDLPFWGRE